MSSSFPEPTSRMGSSTRNVQEASPRRGVRKVPCILHTYGHCLTTDPFLEMQSVGDQAAAVVLHKSTRWCCSITLPAPWGPPILQPDRQSRAWEGSENRKLPALLPGVLGSVHVSSMHKPRKERKPAYQLSGSKDTRGKCLFAAPVSTQWPPLQTPVRVHAGILAPPSSSLPDP